MLQIVDLNFYFFALLDAKPTDCCIVGIVHNSADHVFPCRNTGGVENLLLVHGIQQCLLSHFLCFDFVLDIFCSRPNIIAAFDHIHAVGERSVGISVESFVVQCRIWFVFV